MNSTTANSGESGLLNESKLKQQDVRERRMLLSLATPAVLAVIAISTIMILVSTTLLLATQFFNARQK